MTREEIEKVVADCKYKNWQISVHEFKASNRLYLQVHDNQATDNTTGLDYRWSGRKWALSEHMTRTEIVKTALKAVMSAEEHETLENFKYKGISIFDPHINVDDLVMLREQCELDEREEHGTTEQA